MRYGLPFTFLLRQKKAWPTLLVGSVVALVPVLGQVILAGWGVEVHRAVLEGRRGCPSLRFSDCSRLLQVGIPPFLVQVVLSTFWLFVLLASLALGGAIAGLAGFALARGGHGDEAIAGLILAVSSVTLLACVASSYVLAMTLNAAMIPAELGDEPAKALAGLRPRFLRGFFRASGKSLFKGTVAMVMGSSVVVLAGLALLGLGLLPATVLIVAAGAHLRAQIYEAHLEGGGAPWDAEQRSESGI